MQFFLEHGEDGHKREVQWSGSLLTSDGRQTAAKFLLWLSNGAKGYKSMSGRKPAERLVSCIVLCYVAVNVLVASTSVMFTVYMVHARKGSDVCDKHCICH